MSGLSETINYNVLEDDESENHSSSFVVSDAYAQEGHYVLASSMPPPSTSISVATKGIPTDPAIDESSPGSYQWHLVDTYGVNAHQVWDQYTGEGVSVAVFDEGFDYNHYDLTANYDRSRDFDTAGSNDSDAGYEGSDRHGTAVMGVIGADDNGRGTVGVAFDADLIGIRRDFTETTFTSTVEGFEHALSSGADVMNNSWGASTIFTDHPTRDYFGDDTTEVIDAMIDLVNLGRGGLGTSIVFSAGNARTNDDNVNYHGYQNSPYTITVAGSDIEGDLFSSSTKGAAILTTAPAVGITTLDVSGNEGYALGDTVFINGTSFAAPTVSGIIALMYEANPDLGYRDVQEIIAMSSRELDGSSWQTNGGTHWNGTGMHFSHDFGYGLIDAFTAVRLAETWGNEQKTYANMETISVSGTPNITIPERGIAEHTVTISQDINVEQVLLDLVVPHDRAGDLTITLRSPDGTVSTLVETPGRGNLVTDAHGYTGISFQFSTVANWGETSAGDWTILIQDPSANYGGVFESFNLQILGSEITDDDTYYFTDEFQAVVIADTVGYDTLNLAAVREGVNLNMQGGATSTIVTGQNLRLSNLSVIEEAILGDGNDIVRGSDVENNILLGRGDDYIYASDSDDTIDGEDGNDTIRYSGDFDNYTIVFLDALTVQITDNLDAGGTDIVKNVETFIFNNDSFTSVELEEETEAPDLAPPIIIRFGWNGQSSFYTSNTVETTTLTAGDLGVTDASGNLVRLEREVTRLDIDILNAPAQDIESVTLNYDDALNLNIDGARTANVKLGSNTSSSVTLTNTMQGRVETGGGNDVININLTELVSPTTTELYRILSNDGNDTITISGFHSNSRIQAFGGNGNDTITVSVGGDHFLYGGTGRDRITSSDGDDRIYGEDGDDIIYAGGGEDTVFGGENDDEIHGGDGADFLYGDNGNDTLYGDAGEDNIRGGTGSDSLNGGDGDDLLYGQDGNDILNGDAGRDFLYGGTGFDVISGGDGDDYVYAGDEDDVVSGDDGNDFLKGENGNDTLYGGEGADRVFGDQGNDSLFGGNGNDRLYGGGGLDNLNGGAGTDTLYGGNGDDTLYGGEGRDFLYGDSGADTFILDFGAVDRVRDFQLSEGDRIDISDLVTDFNPITDDINDFVEIIIRGTTRTDFYVNEDGVGNDFQQVGIVFGNFTGQTVDTLYAGGDILA